MIYLGTDTVPSDVGVKIGMLVREKAKGCKECGEVHRLTMHHRDPATKRFELAEKIRYSIEEYAAELAKCDVLCHICHDRVHGFNSAKRPESRDLLASANHPSKG